MVVFKVSTAGGVIAAGVIRTLATADFELSCTLVTVTVAFVFAVTVGAT